ncbi:MAG: hypothetical protein ACK55I_10575, partial [bacterium]
MYSQSQRPTNHSARRHACAADVACSPYNRANRPVQLFRVSPTLQANNPGVSDTSLVWRSKAAMSVPSSSTCGSPKCRRPTAPSILILTGMSLAASSWLFLA